MDVLALGAPPPAPPQRPPKPGPLVPVARHGGGALLLPPAPRGLPGSRDQHGCCLCFYTIPAMAMMLLEAALAAHLALNEHWVQDLPEDSTGELHNLLSFIHNNLDLCKWAALAIFATQALSLLLAMILRAMLSARIVDYDSDEDFVVIRRPLLVTQAPAPYLPTTVDARGARPDLWSSTLRHKYGLNTSDYTYNTMDANAAQSQ